MARRSNNISDDWERLSDDSFSVVSAPDSDSDIDIISSPQTNIARNQITQEKTQPSHHHTRQEIREEATKSDTQNVPDLPEARPDTDDPREHPATDSGSATTGKYDSDLKLLQKYVESTPTVPPNGLPAPETESYELRKTEHPKDNNCSWAGGEVNSKAAQSTIDDAVGHAGAWATAAEESCDEQQSNDERRPVNPALFRPGLDTLFHLISGIRKHSAELEHVNLSLASRAITVSDMIRLQLEELEPMIVSYAKFWREGNRDVPLDPKLMDWFSGVRVKFLGLHAEVQRLAKQGMEPASYLGVDGGNLIRCCEALEQLERQMDVYLPVMQVDFNEYIPANQQTLTSTHQRAVSYDSPSHYVLTPPAPARAIRHHTTAKSPPPHDPLRAALERLSDQVHRTIEELSECSSALGHSASQVAADVCLSFGAIFNKLSSTIATGDWETGVAYGGAPPSSLCGDLDVTTIEDFADRLAQALDTLEVPRPDDWRESMPVWTRPMLDSHRRRMLLEEGQLDRLESLAEVLTATLCAEGQ